MQPSKPSPVPLVPPMIGSHQGNEGQHQEHQRRGAADGLVGSLGLGGKNIGKHHPRAGFDNGRVELVLELVFESEQGDVHQELFDELACL